MSKADEERERRLAEALRENLKRRKAQARGEGELIPPRHGEGDHAEHGGGAGDGAIGAGGAGPSTTA